MNSNDATYDRRAFPICKPYAGDQASAATPAINYNVTASGIRVAECWKRVREATGVMCAELSPYLRMWGARIRQRGLAGVWLAGRLLR